MQTWLCTGCHADSVVSRTISYDPFTRTTSLTYWLLRTCFQCTKEIVSEELDLTLKYMELLPLLASKCAFLTDTLTIQQGSVYMARQYSLYISI